MYRPTTLTTLSVFFLSALAAPMSFGDSELDKRTTHWGTGRWFHPGQGACGYLNGDSDPIVAVSPAVYAGNHCNQGLIVTNTANGNTAYARIRDECSECVGDDLDLSEGLFAQIGDTTAGSIQISWYFVDW